MTKTTDVGRTEIVLSWQTKVETPTSFSADHVIDAYESGGQDQLAKILAQLERYEELQDELSDVNRKHAQFVTQYIFAGLEQANLSPIQAFLRQNGVSDVDVIISVSEDKFATEEFDGAFDVVESTLAEYSLDRLRLDISFLPLSDDLNSDALLADGFGLWYTPQA